MTNRFLPTHLLSDRRIRRLVAAALAAITFVACSSEPARQRLNYLKSGERYFEAQEYQQAMIQFRNDTQVDPRSGEAHYQLSRAYLPLGQPDPAYSEVKNAVDLDSKNAQVQLARLMLDHRQYDQAQAIVQNVLKAGRKNARAHAILAEKDTAKGNTAAASLEMEKVVQRDPQRMESNAALGAVYRPAGRLADAEAAYRRALTVAPKSIPAHVALGQFYLSQGNIAAEAEIRNACALDSHLSGTKDSVVRKSLHRYTDRLQALRGGDRPGPKHPPERSAILLASGRLLLALEKYETAEPVLEKS